ncbi:unnamed protein product, partial [Hapterophycus canaliculatus]
GAAAAEAEAEAAAAAGSAALVAPGGGGSATSSVITPSPAAPPSSSRPGRQLSLSRPTPPRGGSAARPKVKGTPPRSSRACKAELGPSSFHSPEPSTSAFAPSSSASSGNPLAVTCNCKKSKCLKLYCECFQRRQYCSECNCMECLNTERTEDLRQVAIKSTIERNPQAFVSKFEKRAGKRSHNAGCNCKKSACLKKYCECFQAAVACGTNCKCVNCKNYEGAAGGRKRRAIEVPPSLSSPSSPRTPPRMSPRVRGAVVAAAAGASA